jgi:hypothetical protein
LNIHFSNLKQINLVKKQDNLLYVQRSCEVPRTGEIRALDSKFKICSKKLTNFGICYNALKLLILRSRVKKNITTIFTAPSFFIFPVKNVLCLPRHRGCPADRQGGPHGVYRP